MNEPVLKYSEIKDSKVSKYFAAGAILFLVLLPFTFLGLAACSFSGFGDGGEYHIVSSTPSPDGKNIAIVYTGWGGGAAGWTFLRATIISADKQFKPEEHHDYIFDLKGGSEVKTIWENNENLFITYNYKPKKTNPYLRVSKEIYSRHTQTNIRFVERNE